MSNPRIAEMGTQESAPALLVNQEGIITALNRRFEETFGWRTEDLVGKTLTTVIPGKLRDAHHLGFSRFLLTERPNILEQPLSLTILTKDGNERLARHFIRAEKHDGQWLFAATIEAAEEHPAV